MLKENWRLVSRLERGGDCLIIALAFVFAYYSRPWLLYWNSYFTLSLPFAGRELAPLKDYAVVLLTATVGYMFVLNTLGAYSSMRLSSLFRLAYISALSSTAVFILLAATLYLLKVDLSRSFIAVFCISVALTLTLERYLMLEFLRFCRRRGMNFRNILVCGLGEQAIRLVNEINRRPELGIRIRAFADLADSGLSLVERKIEQSAFRARLRGAGYNRPVPIVESVHGVTTALSHHAVDEIIITDVTDVMPAVEELVLICSEQGVRTTVAADLFSVGLVKSGLSYFGQMPLIHFQTPPGDQWELSLKRAMDVLVSAFLLLLALPLIISIAVIMKLSSPGPILFRQRRMGLNGRIFTLFKFRSMYRDAESQLDDLRLSNEMAGPVFKMQNDPRITPVGKWLRRFSLDELPQLWNVLIGEMSLVGPRPPIPGEVVLYRRCDRRRLSMRPGLTCTWQVSGRNNIKDFESWVKLDLEYIDNWSLSRDVMLLCRTIPAVLLGTGAR